MRQSSPLGGHFHLGITLQADNTDCGKCMDRAKRAIAVRHKPDVHRPPSRVSPYSPPDRRRVGVSQLSTYLVSPPNTPSRATVTEPGSALKVSVIVFPACV